MNMSKIAQPNKDTVTTSPAITEKCEGYEMTILEEFVEYEENVPILEIRDIFALLELIISKNTIRASQLSERTLRIYCQPPLNNIERQFIRKFLETSLNAPVNIKRDIVQNFIDFERI